MTKGAAAGVEKVIVVTPSLVAEMIAEAIQGLASKEALQVLITGSELEEKITGLVSRTDLEKVAMSICIEQEIRGIFAEEFEQVMSTALPAKLSDPSALALVEQPPLDASLLEGLYYRGADITREEVEGRPRLVSTPIVRPLTPADVLSYRVDGDLLHLVTTDGQKHTVEL
jgi:hypothetical protein